MYKGETTQGHVDRGFISNYDVIPLLEEELGINLSEGPQVPEYVKNNYREREVVNKVRDGLLGKYGNYLSEDQRDWLDHLEDVTLVLSEGDFDKLSLLFTSRVKEDISASDLSRGEKFILHMGINLLKKKESGVRGRIWDPTNAPFLFIKAKSGEYIDGELKEALIAEETIHALSSFKREGAKRLEDDKVSNGRLGKMVGTISAVRKTRTVLMMEEHAAKRYTYSLTEKGEEFLSGQFNFWREMEMKYGEEEMARIYFQGQSDVVSIQKLLEEAKAYHLFYPPY